MLVRFLCHKVIVFFLAILCSLELGSVLVYTRWFIFCSTNNWTHYYLITEDLKEQWHFVSGNGNRRTLTHPNILWYLEREWEGLTCSDGSTWGSPETEKSLSCVHGQLGIQSNDGKPNSGNRLGIFAACKAEGNQCCFSKEEFLGNGDTEWSWIVPPHKFTQIPPTWRVSAAEAVSTRWNQPGQQSQLHEGAPPPQLSGTYPSQNSVSVIPGWAQGREELDTKVIIARKF